MALVITFDGTGIVAYANGATTDTGGGAWGELGAGTVGDTPDVYLYGSNSFGSKYASKDGRTYYQDDTTLNFSTTGELLYMLVNIQSNGAFTLYNDGGTFLGPFNAIIGSSTGDLYHWNIASKGASNGWTGSWKAFVIDPTMTTGTESEGTPDLTVVNTYGVWIDTDVSVRADSIFQSMIVSAKGAIVTGSPTVAAEGWDELAIWCTDYTARAFPLLEIRGETYFMKGALTVGDGSTLTVFSANGSSIECEESSFYNGTAWISTMPADANKVVTTINASIDWTNVSIKGYTDNKLTINTSVGNASTVNGGSIKLTSTFICKSTDVFDSVIIGEYDARTLGQEEYVNCTFDGSSSLTIGSTANFTNTNVMNGVSGVISTIVTDLDYIASTTFNSSGSNYGVDLGNIVTTVTFDWNSFESGYVTGTSGTNVGVTPTGNETILVNVSVGEILTINIGTGASIPSVANSGTGTVNVVAGQSTLTMTDLIEGAQVTLVNSATRVELQNDIVSATGILTYVHGGGETIDILIMDLNYDPNLSDIYGLTLPSSDSTIKFQMIDDSNFDNPA